MVYIRQDQLPKLKEYKYSGVDKSLVSRYVLKPFYTNFVIHLFPMSMAPNAITLSGFGFVILNLLTLLYYNPTLDQECPRWVYASWSIGLFLYQTFDAVDGTQARRTGQSGPLGELFDHGVDALNTSIEVLLFSGAMALGQSWSTILVLFASLLTFYVQTWDEYHTKTLTLGIVSGPVEGVLTLCVVYMITAFTGPWFWHRSLFAFLGVQKGAWARGGAFGGWGETVYEMKWTEWYMVYGGLVLLFSTWSSILNVLQSRTLRASPAPPALNGLLPFIVTWIHIPLYLYLHPSILQHHLIPFTFYAGLTNAYAVGQIIIAHLTKSSFPMHNLLNFPLGLAIVDKLGLAAGLWKKGWIELWMGGEGGIAGFGGGSGEVTWLWMSLGLAVGVYGSFVVDVVVSICDYLDIWCLTIKHPVPVRQNEEKKKR